MLGLSNLPPLTAEDLAEEELIKKLLTTSSTEALTILMERSEDDVMVAAVMVFLDMTRLVIEACATRIMQDESIPPNDALDKALRLLHQWEPAPLAIAFGTPEAQGTVQGASDWLSSITKT
jgi:hypothetical protein